MALLVATARTAASAAAAATLMVWVRRTPLQDWPMGTDASLKARLLRPTAHASNMGGLAVVGKGTAI